MGIRTNGHIRCRLKTGEAAELLEAAYRRQALPDEWVGERSDDEVALYEAALRLHFETFRRSAISAEVCMSFEARDDDAREFMAAVRAILWMPRGAGVWGYLQYQDYSPFELFSGMSMTMQRPDPDIVVHHR